MNALLQPGSDNGHAYEGWEDDLDIVEEISPSFSLRGAGDIDNHDHEESFSRYLMEGRRNTDGTLAVLMIVFALFCFIWAPVMLRRCRGHGHHSATDEIHDLARFEAEARAVRATLQRMSMLNGVLGGEAARGEENDPQLQHRKEFLDNALLTKKVIFQSTSSSTDDSEDNDDDDKTTKEKAEKRDTAGAANNPSSKPAKERKAPPRRQKSNVIVLVNTTTHKKKESKDKPECDSKSSDETCAETEKSRAQEDDNNDGPDRELASEDSIISSKAAIEAQPSDLECNNTTEENNNDSQLEPCSICLTEYSDGDEICWSHNDKCNHFFHKSCIQTWLLTHEECPCCRQDFLCLWSDDEGDEDDNNNNTRLAWSRRSRRSQQSSSTTPDLDWAEELAEEIQQRILQRQRQLQAELHRRERQERMMQFQRQLQLSSSPAALSNPGATALQSGVTQPRNTVISLDDTAASLLLFRHFPTLHHHFASEQLATTFGAGGHTLNDNGDDEDVQVSHFAAGGPTWGPSYRPDLPVVVRTSFPGSSSVFEMVDRSSRRRRLRPGDHPNSQSRSLTPSSSSNERPTAEGNNEAETVTSSQQQQSAGRETRDDGHDENGDAGNNNMTTASA